MQPRETVLYKRLSRRSLLEGVVLGGLGLAAAATVGCEKEKQLIHALDYALLYPDTIGARTTEIVEKTQEFPLASLRLNALPRTSSDDVQSLQELRQFEDNSLKNYGIKAFSFGEDEDEKKAFSLVVEFADRVKIGKIYPTTETLKPAFLIGYKIDPRAGMFNLDTRHTLSYTLNFSGENDSRSPLTTAYLKFSATPEALYLQNLPFVILMNAKFIKVGGRELPSFFLPYRFKLE